MQHPTGKVRKTVDRSGYAFNMAVAETIRNGAQRQKWRFVAMEVPWSKGLSREKGFIDLVIARDQAIGVVECKKVSNDDSLVFLTNDSSNHDIVRSRLNIYLSERKHDSVTSLLEDRFGAFDCISATGSPESKYCAASKENGSANINLDDVAAKLIVSCDGLLGNWSLELRAVTACVPIIVTNASLYTCKFNPSNMDLSTGNIPDEAVIECQQFVRFRKAFGLGAGLVSSQNLDIKKSVEEAERTVFVVNAASLLAFLAGMRMIRIDKPGGTWFDSGD